MGLGPVALSDADAEAGALTLAGARTAAREAASLVKDGVDPIEARKAAREAETKARHAAKAATFEAAARAHVAERASGWRNEKHGAQWLTTLEAHAFPVIGARPIAHIGTDDVLRVLRPIWDRISAPKMGVWMGVKPARTKNISILQYLERWIWRMRRTGMRVFADLLPGEHQAAHGAVALGKHPDGRGAPQSQSHRTPPLNASTIHRFTLP
jgi:hypothetical protein